MLRRCTAGLIAAVALFLAACGGGASSAPAPTLPVTVQISGASSPMNTGATRTFTVSVSNSANTAVMWSVLEQNGGTITQAGVYTAPALPGTFTVKTTLVADPRASATFSVPVVIAVGHVTGYDVGVDYHAYGADFQHTHGSCWRTIRGL